MSEHVAPWKSCMGLSYFLNLSECFLSHVGEIFSYFIFRYLLRPFLSLFSFWDPYNVDVGAFDVISEIS